MVAGSNKVAKSCTALQAPRQGSADVAGTCVSSNRQHTYTLQQCPTCCEVAAMLAMLVPLLNTLPCSWHAPDNDAACRCMHCLHHYCSVHQGQGNGTDVSQDAVSGDPQCRKMDNKPVCTLFLCFVQQQLCATVDAVPSFSSFSGTCNIHAC